jgi:hypothetical protein
VSLRHEDALLFDVFDRWTARSQLLPAIQFDNKHLRTVAWTRWKKALDRSRGLKQATMEHDKSYSVSGDRRCLDVTKLTIPSGRFLCGRMHWIKMAKRPS